MNGHWPFLFGRRLCTGPIGVVMCRSSGEFASDDKVPSTKVAKKFVVDEYGDYLRGSEIRMTSPLVVPIHTLADPLDVMSIVVGSPRPPHDR